MSALTYPPNDRRLTTAQAAARVWIIRRLLRERAIDPLAADLALRAFRRNPNSRVAALATCTTAEIAKGNAR